MQPLTDPALPALEYIVLFEAWSIASVLRRRKTAPVFRREDLNAMENLVREIRSTESGKEGGLINPERRSRIQTVQSKAKLFRSHRLAPNASPLAISCSAAAHSKPQRSLRHSEEVAPCEPPFLARVGIPAQHADAQRDAKD
jgi:hypothetical protein